LPFGIAASTELKLGAKYGRFFAREIENTTMLKEGLHDVDPGTIKFTQPNVSLNFTNGGNLNDFINDLRAKKISPYDVKPIKVVQIDGDLYSLDNRRLFSYNLASLEKIPVEIVASENPIIASKIARRMDPISSVNFSRGQMVTVVSKAERMAELDKLLELNMIRGIHRGY